MKTITTIVAAAALIAGLAAANAQGTTKQMDEQAGGNSGAVERNPNGSTGGTKANPSPPQAQEFPDNARKQSADLAHQLPAM